MESAPRSSLTSFLAARSSMKRGGERDVRSVPVGLPAAGPDTPGRASGALFQREVARAVERQGGTRQIEERASELAGARRARRHAGFEAGPRDASRAEEAPASSDRRSGGILEATPGTAALDAAPAEPNEIAIASGAAGPEAASRSAGARGDAGGPQGGTGLATGAPLAAHTWGHVSARAAGPFRGNAFAAAPANGAGHAAQPASAGNAQVARALELAEVKPGVGKAVTAGAAPGTELAESVEKAQEILRQIRLHIDPAANRAVLDLSPAELGRLWIRMRMNEGRLTTLVRAESQATFELLEERLPELRAVLAEQGIESDRLDLELGFGDSSQAESRAATGEAFRGGRSADTNPSDEPASETLTAPTPDPLSEGHGDEHGVDTYA